MEFSQTGGPGESEKAIRSWPVRNSHLAMASASPGLCSDPALGDGVGTERCEMKLTLCAVGHDVLPQEKPGLSRGKFYNGLCNLKSTLITVKFSERF